MQDKGIECHRVDVTDNLTITECVDTVLARHGKIDVLINNAGISCIGPIAEQPIQDLQRIFDCNVFGAVRCIQAVVPSMAQRKSGCIVNIGSVTSTLTTAWSGPYSASKSALRNLHDALRQELKPFNIQVTYTMAGAMKTSFADNVGATSGFEQYEDPSSLYHGYVNNMRRRARASVTTKAAVPAEQGARTIVEVIERWAYGNKQPPVWFLVGGNAFLYWFLGIYEKIFWWPLNKYLEKLHGL